MPTTPRISSRDAHAISSHLEHQTPFRTSGALKGEPLVAYAGTGRLAREHVESFEQAARAGGYAVYSYATPIAWTADGTTWTVPADRYSVTTSGHQSRTRYAIHLAGGTEA